MNRLGADAPARIPLEAVGKDDNRTEVLEWLTVRRIETQQLTAKCSTRFMRELGLLRQQHEETQASFQKLEQFMYQHGPQQRELETTLSPIAGQLPISMRNGSRLVQRLPGTSVGLSDIALHVGNEAAPTHGVLSISLFSSTDNETIAIWEIPAARLTNGWVRVALDYALGTDNVSLFDSIEYHGKDIVRPSSSVQHPEQRFHPECDGSTIETLPALQIWRWIAGARALIPAHAVLCRAVMQIGGKSRLRRVAPETLATTIDLGTLKNMLPLFQSDDALLVHGVPDHTACGILPAVALPGARQIFASAQTRHAEGPVVEYQLAIMPQDQRPHLPGSLPEFSSHLSSGWVRLSPQEKSQLHILPAEPLECPHDLYLMTRLPAGSANNFGWSTFSNIGIQF
ncbi:hypothetical protein GL286_21650 [Paracoccus aestuariivivens]|uniref:Uncharacterized protein n=2 Tax=Paracoccus aestuariivivens TaxID=1820333 RepID=A0A6L6JGG6_9RHOB|nr:hypothetical protein [Paracoccus aestuariivivens]